MKIKTFGVTLLSTMILTACGGGGGLSESGNGANENIPSDSLGQAVVSNTEWAEYYLTYGSSSNPNLLNKELTRVDKGSLYNSIAYTQSGLATDDSWIITDSLSKEGLYRVPRTKTQWGYHTAVDLSIAKNGSEWTFTPNSELKLKGLKFIINFDVVDLSGKSVSYYLDTYNHLRGMNTPISDPTVNLFLSKFKDLKFPQGSVCLREKTSSTNQPFMDIYYYNPLNTSWLQDLSKYFPEGYTTQQISGYSVHISNEIYDYSRSALLNTGTEYAQGDYYDKAGFIYNIQDEINEIESDIKDDPTDETSKWSLEAVKNQCTLFNKTASTYIDTKQKLN